MNFPLRFISATTVLSAVGIAVLLTACEPRVDQGPMIPQDMVPAELKDCKFFTFRNSSGTPYHIVRCPNSSTSVTKSGKYPDYTSTVEAPASAPSGILEKDSELAKVDVEIARTKVLEAELKVTRELLERKRLVIKQLP